jgi:hypothetical protein
VCCIVVTALSKLSGRADFFWTTFWLRGALRDIAAQCYVEIRAAK